MAAPALAERPLQATVEQMHGRRGSPGWAAPVCVTEFDSNARYSFTDIKAHEWRDVEEVLECKLELLAEFVRSSKACLAFTGAGISTAAGIDDYATKGRERSAVAGDRPTGLRDWKAARPTRAHRVLVAMHEAGWLKHWIQQNHDSLPQKAGYPQHCLNEIHGSLHDPANPIVPYEGSLRDDLYQWLEDWEAKNDLVLALGTSLSGFNVDRLPVCASERSLRGDGTGLVLVNLQQTPYDDLCALRIFGTIDEVLGRLARKLQIHDQVRPMDHVELPGLPMDAVIDSDVFRIPFDERGDPSHQHTVWDLRLGRRVRLTGGPYKGDVGTIVEKSREGHYRIRFEDSINPMLNMKRRPFSLWLGSWWVREAASGFGICPGSGVPFVNVPDEPPQPSPTPELRRTPAPRPALKSKPPPPPRAPAVAAKCH